MVAMLGLEVSVLAQLHTFCKLPAASDGVFWPFAAFAIGTC